MSLGLIKLSAATVASWVISRYLVTDLIGQQWCSFLLVGILAMVPFVSFLSHSLSMMFCTLNAIYNLKVKGKRIGLMDKQFVHAIVLPNDIDYLLHMTNSKYLCQSDFARTQLLVESRLWRIIQKNGAAMVVASTTSRYRASLQLFQRYKISTRVVSWDDKNIFIEHRFVARKSTIKEFVYFVSLVKLRVLKTPVAELMKEYFAAENLEAPDVSVSALVDIMREYDECSSEQLKEELAVK